MPDKAKEQKKRKDKKLKVKDKKKKHKEHINKHKHNDEPLPSPVDEIIDVHPNAAIVWSRAIEIIFFNRPPIIIILFNRSNNIEI